MNLRPPRDAAVEQSASHLLIRASAGSGKTFQLTHQIIRWLAHDEQPEQIMAATFTRKAAGEILDRVLTRLARAALDGKVAAEVAQLISVDPALPRFDQERARVLLVRTARRLNRLQTCTLDAFFARIAGSFALELGLPPGWRIVDEAEDHELQDLAIRDLLARERHRLLDLLRLLSKGEVTRSISQEVRGVVSELLDLYLDAPPSAWQPFDELPSVDPKSVRQALDALREFLLRVQYRKVDKRWLASLRNNIEAAAEEDWLQFISAGLAKAYLQNKESYYGVAIDGEIATLLDPLIERAREVILTRLSQQTAASEQLLAAYTDVFWGQKRRTQALRFDDITRALIAPPPVPVEDDDLPFDELQALERWGVHEQTLEQIYYRLDGRLDHLLLDEFQDTSLPQWSVLSPLAQQVVATGDGSRSFFCVGDVKQAIYGWRGGVAELFDTLSLQLPGLESQPLDVSYRSSPVIMQCVNQLFSRLDLNGALHENLDAARSWGQGFEQHSTARKELAGYARLECGPLPEEHENPNAVVLHHAVEQIAAWRDVAPDYDIGVLVRENDAVAELIAGLRYAGVEASEEGGNPLTDSVAVTLILSALRVADHPDDRVSLFHVTHSPLGKRIGLQSTDPRGVPPRESAHRVGRHIRQQLLDRGYGNVIDEWVESLAPYCSRRDNERLDQLSQLAHVYDPRATLRPSDFVRSVERTSVESPSGAKVRVMTIHQAKGLQFDIVVLPQLGKRLVGQNPTVLVEREHPLAPPTRICRYASAEVRALAPEILEPMYDAWRRDGARESLSLLYVAMTRAVHALHMIVPARAKTQNKLSATFEGVLRGGLVDHLRASSKSVLYAAGDPEWHGGELLEVGLGRVAERAMERSEAARNDRENVAKPQLSEPATEAKSILTTQTTPAPEASTTTAVTPSSESTNSTTRARSRKRRKVIANEDTQMELCFAESIDEGDSGEEAPVTDSTAAITVTSGAASEDATRPPSIEETRRQSEEAAFLRGDSESPDDPARDAGTANVEKDVSEKSEREFVASPTPQPAAVQIVPIRLSRRGVGSRPQSRWSPSTRSTRSHVSGAELFQPSAAEALLRGAILHTWYESVQWSEDAIPNAEALILIARRRHQALLSDTSWQSLIQQFEQQLSQPAIYEELSREAVLKRTGADSITLQRERAFAVRQGSELITGTIDRLHLIEKEGTETHGEDPSGNPKGTRRIVSAEVIDYKTDRVLTAENEEHYQTQLAAYCEAIASLYQLPPQQVVGRLLFMAQGRVSVAE